MVSIWTLNHTILIFCAFIALLQMQLASTASSNVEQHLLIRRAFMQKAKDGWINAFGTKKQKQEKALRDVKDPHTHIGPKQLKRLDTITLGQVGPEFTSMLHPKEAIKVGKEVKKRVEKHATRRDEGFHQMGSEEYERLHFTKGTTENDKLNLIQKQFGHESPNANVIRPETKNLIHKDIQNSQDKIDRLQPLHNVIMHRTMQADAVRDNKFHPDHTSKSKIMKGYNNIVDAGMKVNKLETKRMLEHQVNAHRELQEKLKSSTLARTRGGGSPPSAHANHPNRPITSPQGSSHPELIGQPNKASEAVAKHNNHPEKEHVKPEKMLFEGKEHHWSSKNKPSIQYFMGNEFVQENEYVKNHGSPLAKTPQLAQYVQPRHDMHYTPPGSTRGRGAGAGGGSVGSGGGSRGGSNSPHNLASPRVTSPPPHNEGSSNNQHQQRKGKQPVLDNAPTFSRGNSPNNSKHYKTRLPENLSNPSHQFQRQSSGSSSDGESNSNRRWNQEMSRRTRSPSIGSNASAGSSPRATRNPDFTPRQTKSGNPTLGEFFEFTKP